ncbi:hypothetical protein M409DRAFT_49231 [Zasmidium cellare ATCC 36951]|uniref:Uncharacterized protein n=1 Tax=Zasmidium cellare ATCC 36951 TaxID=1080233 RepID=A0A6A6D2P2_ZASCE|nr:uncharacterized protein M409DRAFT_49231 [Zasmidium cellare ATCC 36951]KAF2172688.1 hypothetical protein M409DRAFT_49231 [Zasmidium cellare ATCC 36951]
MARFQPVLRQPSTPNKTQKPNLILIDLVAAILPFFIPRRQRRFSSIFSSAVQRAFGALTLNLAHHPAPRYSTRPIDQAIHISTPAIPARRLHEMASQKRPAYARAVLGGEDVQAAAKARADAAKPYARRLEDILRELPAYVEDDGEQEQLRDENQQLRAQLEAFNSAGQTQTSSTAQAAQSTQSIGAPARTIPRSSDLTRPTSADEADIHRLEQKRDALLGEVERLKKSRTNAWSEKPDAEQQLRAAVAEQARAEELRNQYASKCADAEDQIEELKTQREELDEDDIRNLAEDKEEASRGHNLKSIMKSGREIAKGLPTITSTTSSSAARSEILDHGATLQAAEQLMSRYLPTDPANKLQGTINTLYGVIHLDAADVSAAAPPIEPSTEEGLNSRPGTAEQSTAAIVSQRK